MKKVILVTGGSTGIGKSICEYLFSKGYIVYGTSRKPVNNNQLYTVLPLELTDKNSIKKAVEIIIKIEGRIDVLINNAGIGITGAIEETSTDEMKKAFDINFFGTVDVIKTVLPQMRKQKSGLIISVTSIAAYMGLPFRGTYSAIKGATELMTETISMEVKKFGIKVVNIAPGDYKTDIAANRYYTPFYENSVYKEAYKKNITLMDKQVQEGNEPIVLAKKIYKIINAKNPKIHYKTGSFLQKVAIIVKHIIPGRLFEKLLIWYYKL